MEDKNLQKNHLAIFFFLDIMTKTIIIVEKKSVTRNLNSPLNLTDIQLTYDLLFLTSNQDFILMKFYSCSSRQQHPHNLEIKLRK